VGHLEDRKYISWTSSGLVGKRLELVSCKNISEFAPKRNSLQSELIKYLIFANEYLLDRPRVFANSQGQSYSKVAHCSCSDSLINLQP